MVVKNLIEVDILARLVFEDLARGVETQLVSLFQLPIVGVKLLNSIVSEMHEGLVNGLLAESESVRAGPDVSLLKQIHSLVL